MKPKHVVEPHSKLLIFGLGRLVLLVSWRRGRQRPKDEGSRRRRQPTALLPDDQACACCA